MSPDEVRPQAGNPGATQDQVAARSATRVVDHPLLGWRLTVDVTDRIRRQAGIDDDQRRCDFCGNILHRRWTRFACRDFNRVMYNNDGQPALLQMDGFWAGCRECAPYVTARQWGPLADRVHAIYQARRPTTEPTTSMLRAELAALYLQLARHLTGEHVRVRAAA